MSLGSGAFQGEYSFPSRFADARGTNPEELIAAAHAGCYSMALAHALATAGHVPTSIETTAAVRLDKTAEGFVISRIELTTRGAVPGVDATTFDSFARSAKTDCPVSKALASVPITLNATLVTA